MADPSGYTVSYSFANYQANKPNDPLPGTSLDDELADISAKIDGLVSAVKDVRRSDGALKNAIVTLDSLSVGVIAGTADLDTDAADALDAAVAAIQTNLDTDLADLDAAKADVVHTHTAAQVSVTAITGISATTLQGVLEALRAFAPQTGDVKFSIDDTAPDGWIACDDGTIGAEDSAATNRANDDTEDLYTLLWNKVSDTYAPVTGGRGLSAALDFAALKPIALTKMLGRALAVAGDGADLTSREVGETLGAETVTLTLAQTPAHNHGGSTGATVAGEKYTSTPNIQEGTSTVHSVWQGTENNGSHTHTIASAGGGEAHSNMQPSAFLYAFLKL